ncbi:VOC family protein [Silvimonas iriomotensis]|uniref:Glyoxalase n=1 Tax=Silvimonas iriomotensis TaxID=449662 RepID=A0ABQ2PB61_9NEIS|nr:VOC family protein [Silvimonas iriomotensis]GGP22697.1 glyoxalase [Silvimonas iriomotensis]
MMKIEKPGIVLFTQRYPECVRFYHELIGLPLLFTKPTLTCLQLGQAYLMVESGGIAKDTQKHRGENPVVIRFNVANVSTEAAVLRARGVPVEVMQFDWGIIGLFTDPDGNRCELKNSEAAFGHVCA